ncbi:hypothetical protein [Streptomyces chartreusis]|uniref:hypothetical protein n=1 Tax=Streptomyces chartreusis TaxID=1969 RepID=UPI0033EF3B82
MSETLTLWLTVIGTVSGVISMWVAILDRRRSQQPSPQRQPASRPRQRPRRPELPSTRQQRQWRPELSSTTRETSRAWSVAVWAGTQIAYGAAWVGIMLMVLVPIVDLTALWEQGLDVFRQEGSIHGRMVMAALNVVAVLVMFSATEKESTKLRLTYSLFCISFAAALALTA